MLECEDGEGFIWQRDWLKKEVGGGLDWIRRCACGAGGVGTTWCIEFLIYSTDMATSMRFLKQIDIIVKWFEVGVRFRSLIWLFTTLVSSWAST